MQRVFPISRGLLASTGLVLLLAGCNGQEGRGFDWDLRSREAMNTADAVRNATAPRPNADTRGVISYPNYQVVIARPNETVSSVAARLGMRADDLARTNAIQPDISLQGGEVLVLPRRVSEPQTGTVLPSLAPIQSGRIEASQIATTALDRVNNTPAPNVPFGTSREPAANTTPASAAPRAQVGAEPVRHRVQAGETAIVIARRYNVTTKALAEWNGLNSQMTVRLGQTLLIPPADPNARPPVRAAAVTTAPGQGSPTPQPPSATKPLPQENPTRAGAATQAAPPAPSLPTTQAAGKLSMPVSGSVFKSYQKGRYDGIGISAAAGSSVKAAADGTVLTVTRDRSQVSIVMIRHANNLATVYANLDGITVEKGAQVRRGQQIGTVKASNPPFLHFEVRRGAESVDPMSVLQ